MTARCEHEAKWRVGLTGHEFDLKDIAALFSQTSSTAYYVSPDKNTYYLYCCEFKQLDTPRGIRDHAIDLLSTMNGLAKVVSGDFQSVQLEHVEEIMKEGKNRQYVFAEPAIVNARIRAILTVKRLRVDGTEETIRSSKFESSKSYDAVNILQVNLSIELALSLYGSLEHNWRNLYMVLEVIEHAMGGEDALRNKSWAAKNKIKLFKRTANSYAILGKESRHGPDSKKPPSKPMTLVEAQGLIRALLQRWIEEETAK